MKNDILVTCVFCKETITLDLSYLFHDRKVPADNTVYWVMLPPWAFPYDAPATRGHWPSETLAR
jgi:hypothetical protein